MGARAKSASVVVLALAVSGCSLLLSTSGFDDPVVVRDAAPDAVDGPSSLTDANDMDAGADARTDAGGILWSSNGHRYLVVVFPSPIGWNEAKAHAEGMGGHLATITSADEERFVGNLFANREDVWDIQLGPWLGGYQAITGNEPTGGWSWVTGELFGYTDWSSGKPDDLNGTEDCLQFLRNFDSVAWNDIDDDGDSRSVSAIVEFE